MITPAIQKFITAKNNSLEKSKDKRDPQKEETLHKRDKDYKNILFTPSRKAKRIITTNISKANMNSIKNTWKGIRSGVTIKSILSDISKILMATGNNITR